MDITPAEASPKRMRAKKLAAPPTEKPVKISAKRGSKATSSAPHHDGHELAHMIATAAYYLAAERGFTPGHELDDWLAAEQKILSP